VLILKPSPRSRSYSKRANAIRPYNNIIAPMVGAHCVRPQCPHPQTFSQKQKLFQEGECNSPLQ
ncbi:hypothetical protein, partial [Microcystis aeruginosa]|uniref:hypothetical protein n=1 Tax=Microcystis aeruginosa TaxID=1126 RepID=UPI001C207AFD